MDAISTRDLTKVFGTQVAVDHLSVTVPTGKVTGFLGPNGAGKTTTMRMILGLFRPTYGHSAVMGLAYRNLGEPVRTVGSVLETSQFHPLRSARNHLRIVARASGLSQRRVDEVLAMVDLADEANKKVGHYSLGMRQRLGIAGALLGDPLVLVLDEPANGLDPAGIRWLRSFLRSFATDGRAVFVSSHLLGEVSEMADDVVVINKGRLVAHAPVAELLRHASPGVRVQTTEPERLRALLVAAGVEVSREGDDELSVVAASELVGHVAAQAGIPILGLHIEERSLEDIFFQLTASDERGVSDEVVD